MLVLVTYDVSTQDDNGKRRLHQVAKQWGVSRVLCKSIQ